MLTLPLRCSRAPTLSSSSSLLLRSLSSNFSTSSPILNALHIRPQQPQRIQLQSNTRLIHASSITQRFALRPSQILRWPSGPTAASAKNDTPSFREKIAPELQKRDTFAQKVGKPGALLQTLFVLITGYGIFMYWSDWSSDATEHMLNKFQSPSGRLAIITSEDLERVRRMELLNRLRSWGNTVNNATTGLPELLRYIINRSYHDVFQTYFDISDGKRLMWNICLLNVGIWLAWKVPGLHRVMRERFMHDPLSGKSYTLLTSTFSHKAFWHLLVNCLALEGFGASVYYYFNREAKNAQPALLESTTGYHFMAFFVTAGMFSSLVSHIVSTKLRYPLLLRNLTQTAATKPKVETWNQAYAAATSSSAALASSATKKAAATSGIMPSLGASGAIYSCIVLTALAFPESQISLFYPPTYPIDVQTGVGALLLLDVIGIWRGWRMFDHCAHLGGAAFGWMYYMYGPRIWDHLRRSADNSEELLVYRESPRDY